MVGDQQPGEALDERQDGSADLEREHARCEQPRGRGGDHEHGADEQGADGVERGDRRERDGGDQDPVGEGDAKAERPAAERIEAGGDPRPPAGSAAAARTATRVAAVTSSSVVPIASSEPKRS